MFSSEFMFSDQSKKVFDSFYLSDQENKVRPCVVCIKNGTILPQKSGYSELAWGAGGLLDENGCFVPESKVETGFGAPYPYEEKDVLLLKESVIFIPVIPNHWGHFLINVLCRLWDQELLSRKLRIAYCGFGWPNGEIDHEDILQALFSLGIEKQRLFPITKPTRFSQVFLPGETFGYAAKFNLEYARTAKRIRDFVLSSDYTKELVPYDKIYFTRRNFLKSKFNEFGEKDIQDIFRHNGYQILSPERLSFYQEVFYFAKAKEIACMSGTISHNAIFMSSKAKIYIMNRTSDFNPPEVKIIKYFGLSAYLVDCYCNYLRRHKIRYGDGPFWISPNLNFQNFAKAVGLKISFFDKCKIPFHNLCNFFKFFLFLFVFRPLYTRYKKVKKIN